MIGGFLAESWGRDEDSSDDVDDAISAVLSRVNARVDAPSALIARCEELEGVLRRIAAPRRPDGTYNLSREACEQIAREALRRD